MSARDDIRIQEAHARPITEVADLLSIGGLKRGGHEMIGPCPKCGGRDRFSLNVRKNVFNCRRCGGAGDQIRLVEFVLDLTFPAALDWLCGPVQELTPKQREAREKQAEFHRRQREAEAEKYRQQALEKARRIWEEGREPEGTFVRDYLVRRGIPKHLFPFPKSIRFHPALPYWHGQGHSYLQVHKGPAMLAAVQGPDNRFRAVHQTWIDLDQPKGKVLLPNPDEPGKFLPSKKVDGIKKGGAIRLRERPLSGDALIMAEGIETTLSAFIADTTGAAFWCGVDLGNMSGQRMLGKGQKYAGIPDMTDDEAFVPPEWVRELIFIQDGDSEQKLTKAKLLSGCRRAMLKRRGLSARIVPVPLGKDLNDVLMGVGDEP